MAEVSEWNVATPDGKRHRVRVDRALLGALRVRLDGRILPRFDRGPDGDRYVFSLAGHVGTVVVPAGGGPSQATFTIDGRAVASEIVLTEALPLPTAAGAAPGSTVSAVDLLRYQLTQRRDTNANWFYWIAGASILNTLLFAAQADTGLVIGLGITQIIDGVAIALSDTVRTPIYAVIIDLAIAGGFFLIGRAARGGSLAWYSLGIVLYGADALIFVWAEDWLGFAVHAIGIYALFAGWRAGRALARLQRPATGAA